MDTTEHVAGTRLEMDKIIIFCACGWRSRPMDDMETARAEYDKHLPKVSREHDPRRTRPL